MATPPPSPRRRPASPLEAAMRVHAEDLREEQDVAREQAWQLGRMATDRQRAELRARQAVAEQQRRTQAGEGTPLEEVLDGRERQLVREFMHFTRRAYHDDGRDCFDLATTLPIDRSGSRETIRGFLIGCTGEEPGDSGFTKSSRGLYLCEDGTLRTYRRPDQRMNPDDLPPAEGVPVHPATGDYVDIIPGHFVEATVPRRRAIKMVDGRVPPLPPGVESAGTPYKDSGIKTYYQTHNVHPYRAQTLEQSLAATAYHVIQQEEPRPMYDRYSPEI